MKRVPWNRELAVVVAADEISTAVVAAADGEDLIAVAEVEIAEDGEEIINISFYEDVKPPVRRGFYRRHTIIRRNSGPSRPKNVFYCGSLTTNFSANTRPRSAHLRDT